MSIVSVSQSDGDAQRGSMRPLLSLKFPLSRPSSAAPINPSQVLASCSPPLNLDSPPLTLLLFLTAELWTDLCPTIASR